MKRLSFVLFIMLIFTTTSELPSKAETLYMPPEKSREELYQDIFISTLMPKIDEAVNEYYKNILTIKPTVYPYMAYVEAAERINSYRSFDFLLTVKVYPVVGPHIEVGIDRLSIVVSGSGKVELKKFEHLKDYNLPNHWQDIKKIKKIEDTKENRDTQERKERKEKRKSKLTPNTSTH